MVFNTNSEKEVKKEDYSHYSPHFKLPQSVQEMRDIHISGNVVPMNWFKTIIFDNGKPDTNSILILSDIVYWHRPTEVRDERSGAIIGHRKKIFRRPSPQILF